MCGAGHISDKGWLEVCSTANRSRRQLGSLRWGYISYRTDIHIHPRAGGKAHPFSTRISDEAGIIAYSFLGGGGC